MTSRPPRRRLLLAFALATVAWAPLWARAGAGELRRRRRPWSGRGAASSTPARTRVSRGWWPTTARRRTRRCAASSSRPCATPRAPTPRSTACRRGDARAPTRATSGCGTGRWCGSTPGVPRRSTPPRSRPRSAPSCGPPRSAHSPPGPTPRRSTSRPRQCAVSGGRGRPARAPRGGVGGGGGVAARALRHPRVPLGRPRDRRVRRAAGPRVAHQARGRALHGARLRDRRRLVGPAPLALAPRARGRPPRPRPRRSHRRRHRQLLRPRRHRRPGRLRPRRLGLHGRPADGGDAGGPPRAGAHRPSRRLARGDRRLAPREDRAPGRRGGHEAAAPHPAPDDVVRRRALRDRRAHAPVDARPRAGDGPERRRRLPRPRRRRARRPPGHDEPARRVAAGLRRRADGHRGGRRRPARTPWPCSGGGRRRCSSSPTACPAATTGTRRPTSSRGGRGSPTRPRSSRTWRG